MSRHLEEQKMGVFFIQEVRDFGEAIEILSPEMIERLGGESNIKSLTICRSRVAPFWRTDALKVTKNLS